MYEFPEFKRVFAKFDSDESEESDMVWKKSALTICFDS